MACKQPEKFGTGVHEINYKDRIFYGHRWDEWYNENSDAPILGEESTYGSYLTWEIRYTSVTFEIRSQCTFRVERVPRALVIKYVLNRLETLA